MLDKVQITNYLVNIYENNREIKILENEKFELNKKIRELEEKNQNIGNVLSNNRKEEEFPFLINIESVNYLAEKPQTTVTFKMLNTL